jgi:hypothetical protein
MAGAGKGAPPMTVRIAMEIGNDARPGQDEACLSPTPFASAPTAQAPDDGDGEFETVWRALVRLSDPVGVTPATIAADLELTLAGAEDLIDRLEAIGLVVRRAQSGMGKAFLTLAAQRLVAMIAKSADAADGQVLALFDEGAPGRMVAMPEAISEWLVAALA